MDVKVKRAGENIYSFTAGIGEWKTYKLPYELNEGIYGFSEDQWKHLSDIIARIWINEEKNLRKNRKRKAAGYHKTYVDDSLRTQKDEEGDPKK